MTFPFGVWMAYDLSMLLAVTSSGTNGPSPVVELLAQQGSEGHRDSPIFGEDLGVADCQSNDIKSISTLGLESIVEDSMGLLSLFQEAEDTRVKPQGDKILRINSMVDFRPKEVNVDTPEQEQYRIAKELQETIIPGNKLGIKYDDAGVLRMKKMIEQEAKDLEIILRDNLFAPLQRNESRVQHRSSLAF
ncbi:hypothetical protein RHSIM_Rhsim05G0211700 [Rhododendron simsii]|uniref:Uncharacterized protein n=1 Tax=Rhododendron simsii TaxID=118357 RepID=A0A834GW48_RHOSS|nr:hypothetical protein RHSIM_Rhsim05G0211700 [Rhododendron simsii]